MLFSGKCSIALLTVKYSGVAGSSFGSVVGDSDGLFGAGDGGGSRGINFGAH